MAYRPPPLPTEERAKLTEALMRERRTDLARWADAENLATQWDARAQMAARMIPAGQSVLDVGAGAMALKALLAEGCRYTPADVVSRCEGCLVADLNKGEFPAGEYDWVTLLGVLEYVFDVAAALRRAAAGAPNLIVTYCCYVGGDPLPRRGLGWVNDLDREAFEALLRTAGWRHEPAVEVKRGPTNIQLMYRCARTA
jgi:hypothetical protein